MSILNNAYHQVILNKIDGLITWNQQSKAPQYILWAYFDYLCNLRKRVNTVAHMVPKDVSIKETNLTGIMAELSEQERIAKEL